MANLPNNRAQILIKKENHNHTQMKIMPNFLGQYSYSSYSYSPRKVRKVLNFDKPYL